MIYISTRYYDNATYNLVFTVETVQYNKYQEAWGNNVNIISMKPMNATQLTLKSNPLSITNYNDGNVHEMYTFKHDATAQTPALTEYRYIGDNPYNYVYFNCDSLDNQSTSTCEVWRILGVFDVDDGNGNYEQRIKLVSGNSIKNDKWNTAQNSNSGYNDWTVDNATLKVFLNGDYYNGTATNGLKESARNMIGNAIYYLGGRAYDSTTHYGSTEEIYAWERGTTTCGACNSDATKLTWTGKVALMYPSDMYMTYGNGVNTTCYNNPYFCSRTTAPTGWVYNSNKLTTETSPSITWFLSPYSSHSGRVYYAFSTGYLYEFFAEDGSFGVRPVAYLKSDIKITEGTGEQNNPYKLGL